MTTQTPPQKSSITQRLRTDLGRSVGITTVTQLVWLTWLRAQPSHSPQQPCNQKDTLFKTLQFTNHVYHYSKHYAGVGSCFKGGGDVAEAKKNRKCGYLILVVLHELPSSLTVSSQFFEWKPINSVRSF